MNFLVTGAAGYIGSHFIAEVLGSNNKVIGIDNFSNSTIDQIEILKKINERDFKFYQCDILDSKNLAQIFRLNPIDIVVHFAALKSIPESNNNKEKYFLNNVDGTRNILKAMIDNDIKNIIFSSSAAVYGNSSVQPVNEKCETLPQSFYAETKKICEETIISEAKKKSIKAMILRYFNPIGFDSSIYKITERLYSEQSLISNIIGVINGKKDFFQIYGGDYNTKDGTAERDFIHINDLIRAHTITAKYFENINSYEIFNVGTGRSVSVKEFVTKFSTINKINIPIKITKKRQGDLEISFTDTKKIQNKLSFKPTRSLDLMCKDSFKLFN